MAQTPNGAQSSNALIWIDLEMTGLNPETDRIIEDARLAGMDDWNQRPHAGTGLIERVKQSPYSEADVERLTLEFLQMHVPKNKSPMCGNSICQDRRFLARTMPQLEAWFHYRNLDVSSIKELVKRWKPSLCSGMVKKNTHKAIDDISESIDELKYYREHF